MRPVKCLLGTLRGKKTCDINKWLNSERFRSIPRTWVALRGTLGLSIGSGSLSHYGRRERDQMHPYSPSRRWLAVPGIGFPQSISVGPDGLDLEDFRERSFTARC